MTTNNTIIIVSGIVDATIREYQPDIEFIIFKSISDLGDYLDKTPIRAKTLFFTQDVIGEHNRGFTYLKDLVTTNDYLNVDEVVYITYEDSPELVSLKFLIDENELENWEIITGSMTRTFVTEVINGTFRDDNARAKYKAVYRKSRADYIKQQLRKKDSLDEEYIADEKYLSDIPDEEIPTMEHVLPNEKIKKVYIAGNAGMERTAFAFITAQYLSLNHKVVIVESDPDYHLLTEFSTKTDLEALHITVTQLYEQPDVMIQAIKDTPTNLVIIECIDRLDFKYDFVTSLLTYNLKEVFDYIVIETSLEDIPYNTHCIVTMPSTVIGVLSTGEKIDQILYPYCHFVAVNFDSLPDIRINSGIVVSTLLSDLLSLKDIPSPVVTIKTLRLNSAVYDLQAIYKDVI